MSDIIILALATYRLADLVTDPKQTGPARLLEHMAYQLAGMEVDWAKLKWFVRDETGHRRGYRPGSTAHWLACFDCFAVAAALFCCLLWATPLRPVVTVLAVAGLARVVFQYAGRPAATAADEPEGLHPKIERAELCPECAKVIQAGHEEMACATCKLKLERA